MGLPRVPDIRLDGEASSSLDPEGGFLRLERLRLRLSGEVASEPFDYDVVTRKALDSVVIAAHFMRGSVRHVMLLTALRPPIWWRDRSVGVLWELPAGLIEPGESPRDAAARELFEEVGARLEPSALEPLGPNLLVAPGMVAEVQSYFHGAIDPAALTPPPGDASALERASIRAAVPLDEALALCARGDIRDLKTELALRRLKERVG